MYRLNCHLTDELGDRLGDYCERAGVTKVTVVSMALDQYLNEQEVKCKLLEQLSDPMKLTEICKILGMSEPDANQ
jgi:predicted DNA-binding protein